jgi:hypothetical protein
VPQYKEHIIGSVAAYAAVLLVCSLYEAPTVSLLEWLAWAIAGGLFPDIDIKSKGQKYAYRLFAGGTVYLAMQEKFRLLAALCLIACFPLTVKHRGIFHELWFIIALVATVVVMMTSCYPLHAHRILVCALFFIAGAISHLWLDMGPRRMLKLK